jgi:glycine C-acetyltransferase
MSDHRVSSADALAARHRETIEALERDGQYKRLRPVSGPIGPTTIVDGREVVVLCSNDYLSLANHPDVVAAGVDGLHSYGAGTASVRFICGTLDAHVDLERRLAELTGLDSALTFVSCWNANEALFPTVTAPGDVVISDELNHASLIDAIRGSRGVDRVVYPHADLQSLEVALAGASNPGVRWVVTDGVFSMEGDLAPLPEIVELCKAYDAVLVVDDSHGIGVLGPTGRGIGEHFSLAGDIDIVTGTLGKALGGAAGGFVAAGQPVIELLVQRGRPSLFSNALPATVASSATAAVEVMRREPDRVARLHANASTLRRGLRDLGYLVEDSPSAIIPIILSDAAEVGRASGRLFELGVMVVGFSFPVVPVASPRLRIQASAGLTDDHLAAALSAFGRL